MLVPNRDDILRTWQIFREPGETLEVRIPKAQKYKTISGYFDDSEKFVSAIVELSSRDGYRFVGHYFTINPVKRDLLARSYNRVKSFVEITTSDQDVEALHWLPIDIDAIRPANISSTDAEHEAAISKACEIRQWLIEDQGWPENAFVLADSGNGGHLCVRIDMEIDKKDIVDKILKKLHALFSNDVVKVDVSNFNPARIWKVYGTPCQKGDDIPERPHRLAKILEVPDIIESVDKDKLEALAGIETPSHEPVVGWAEQMPRDSSFDVVKYIESHGAKIVKSKQSGEYTTYIFDVCPFNSDHTDKSAMISKHSSGKLSFKCQHDGCQGKVWKDLRALWEPNRLSERAASTITAAPEGEPDFFYVTKDSPPWTVGLHQETGFVCKVVIKKNKETEETFQTLQHISECALRIDTETSANKKTEFTFKGVGAIDKREVCFVMPAEDMATHAKFKGAVINAFGGKNAFEKLTYPLVQACSKNIRLMTRIEIPCWKNGLPLLPGMNLLPNIEYRLPAQIPARVYDGDLENAMIVLNKAMKINRFAPILIATILGSPVFARWFKTERFGLGIWGLTNSLKTSTVCALLAVWGTGYMDGPTLKSGRAGTTAYAATVIFALAGWLPQLLDNVKTVDPRDAIDYIGTINAVLEGSSKNQGTKDKSLRETMEYWCTPIVTGEVRPQETATTSRVPAIQWDGVDANILLEVQSSISVMPTIGYKWLMHLATIKEIDRTAFDKFRSMKRDEFIKSGHTVAGRTATIYSLLKLVWAMLEVSPLGEVFQENEKRFMTSLDELAKNQGENTDDETESARFIAGVKELMVGRPDLFQEASGMNIGNKVIGKIMPNGVWLLPIETLSELGKIKTFTQIPTVKSMTEALDQASMLVHQGDTRKYQARINGTKTKGWYVKLDVPENENDICEQ